jgi:hypothetical protein
MAAMAPKEANAMSKPDWDEETDAGWYRKQVGHRIERGMNRLLGLVLGGAGLWALYVSLTSESFTLKTHWFGLVAAAALLFLAHLCFKARRSIVEGFGEEPTGPPARRNSKP